ncbi:MAG: HNH endonuclease [Candidatus Omnitrophica bacterium]|nr:HNH endonuclease [Candidatus Omnitrophota bacterium]MBU1048113.1 HNH endonuclease [Candidatus Omnitrophota bacterium]MBU1630757.1 HNH endonuclease [Candidatus Omnitrophota bacterium]MBU1766979.1 HNH endonuclease [Candidatus Omnitrophota bacterium]MBU1889203.1 HNH endonuclease [Candidatus Omnitrophota bacterium]
MAKIIAFKKWHISLDDNKGVTLDLPYPEKFENNEEKEKYEKAKNMEAPTLLIENKFLFGEWLFELNNYERTLDDEKIKLILLEAIDKERKKFERLKKKFSTQYSTDEIKRKSIPEEVRIFVWRRDGGRCVECNSQENLEFDHIIPVSQGGSSTARNIQLLCEKCNRQKSNKI